MLFMHLSTAGICKCTFDIMKPEKKAGSLLTLRSAGDIYVKLNCRPSISSAALTFHFAHGNMNNANRNKMHVLSDVTREPEPKCSPNFPILFSSVLLKQNRHYGKVGS